MLQKKYLTLLQFLMEQTAPVTAKNISLYLNVSVRTVKNYIQEINTITHSAIIQSSNAGYTVNKKAASIFINNETYEYEVPQNWEERFEYIFRIIYSEYINEIDIYDLCDEMYISVSTLRSDVEKMNNILKKYKAKFSIEKNFLVLKADESDIRKLKMDLLLKQLNQPFTDIQKLKEEFPNLNIQELVKMVSKILRKHKLSMNDIAFGNFLLYLCVSAERLLNKQYPAETIGLNYDNTLHPASVEIGEFMKNCLEVPIRESDIHSLNILLKANTNLTYTNKEETVAYIGKECLALCEDICKKVKDKYFVDLSAQSFQLPFAMHLKTLLFRASKSMVLKNPMADVIRRTNLYIFDLAVFISIQIAQKKNIMLDENEIAYIAVHIGAELQRQQNAKEKIQAVLYCSDYRNTAQELTEAIKKYLSNDIYICRIITSFYEIQLPMEEIDILITTYSVSKTEQYEVFQISPIPTSEELLALERLCIQIRHKKQCHILLKHFDDYFCPDLFLVEEHARGSKEEIIQLMADKVINTGVVGAAFRKDVLEREASASTGFSGIAIPHGTKENAAESRICVVLDKKGINWSGQLVYVVLLFALNQNDQSVFPQLYEALIYIFQQKENILQVKNIKDFLSFKQYIFSLLS